MDINTLIMESIQKISEQSDDVSNVSKTQEELLKSKTEERDNTELQKASKEGAPRPGSGQTSIVYSDEESNLETQGDPRGTVNGEVIAVTEAAIAAGLGALMFVKKVRGLS